MNKKIAFLIYSWGTTVAFIILIFWLSTVPHLANDNSKYEGIIKTVYRLTLYGLLFLLIYRSLITTFRTTITRLSKWHSEKEKEEDAVFVLIIETLLVVISVLASSLISIIDEFIQSHITGRSAEVQDVLVSLIAILTTSILVYGIPAIGEIEVAIKHTFFNNSTKKNDIKKN